MVFVSPANRVVTKARTAQRNRFTARPFLIQIGFLDRTPRGRVATKLAYDHFGIRYGRQPGLF